MERDSVDQLPPDELRDRLRGLNRLLDATRSIASQVDLHEILQAIVCDACKALDCDRASLYQFDPERGELVTRVVTELEISEIRTSLDHGITGLVARNRSVANIPEPTSNPHWNGDVDRRTGYHTRNILAAPLLSPRDGSLVGVLQVLNKLQGQFDAFDEELIQGFGRHAAIALDRAQLVAELREKERTAYSLDIARSIQRGFIPSRMPEVPGYQFAVWCHPNEAVGGDYCDIVPCSHGRIGVTIADVSGHGLGPSLLMASVRAAFRALLLKHPAPEELLALLDRLLADDLSDGKFVTMVVALIDPRSHQVAFANAGHAPALHFCADQDRFASLSSTGLPLGVLARGEYVAGPTLKLELEDVLLLCTDGIVEAVDAAGKQFGEPRLKAIIRQFRQAPANEVVRRISTALTEHVGDRQPSDDLTILAVKRIGA